MKPTCTIQLQWPDCVFTNTTRAATAVVGNWKNTQGPLHLMASLTVDNLSTTWPFQDYPKGKDTPYVGWSLFPGSSFKSGKVYYLS